MVGLPSKSSDDSSGFLPVVLPRAPTRTLRRKEHTQDEETRVHHISATRLALQGVVKLLT